MDYRILRLDDCEPEELASVIDGTSMRHRLLPGGRLGARVEQLTLPSGGLQRGRYEMAVLAEGEWPQGCITIGFVLSAPDTLTLNGMICPSRSMQIYPERCDLAYRAPPRSTWLAYCVERARIQETALLLRGQELRIPESSVTSTALTADEAARVAVVTEALFRQGRAPAAEALRRLEDQFRATIVALIERSHESNRPGQRRREPMRRALMSRAEDYLRANLTDSFDLNALAATVGTSARMLEYNFQQVYGTTPVAWFRSMKLNAAHADLSRTRDPGVRVSDIATRYGFMHLGRFSVEYRKLFGRSPRDTLRRGPVVPRYPVTDPVD